MPARAQAPLRREAELAARLVELFYVEALLLLDEAQAYCDHPDLEGGTISPAARAAIGEAFEGVFARLDSVLAWLRARRGDAAAGADPPRIAEVIPHCDLGLECLPDPAHALVRAAADLYDRIQRLEAGGAVQTARPSPARDLQGRLRSSF